DGFKKCVYFAVRWGVIRDGVGEGNGELGRGILEGVGGINVWIMGIEYGGVWRCYEGLVG
ncbi:hypothetical protein, partial [Siminovitchia fortis]|uniref:hypothetical protein n=1 Tax=Siminovitchia fortis TaxID=254758 RepID=UPI001C930F02